METVLLHSEIDNLLYIINYIQKVTKSEDLKYSLCEKTNFYYKCFYVQISYHEHDTLVPLSGFTGDGFKSMARKIIDTFVKKEGILK